MTEERNALKASLRLKQLRADALLGKKKHYNAADRKQVYQDRIGVALVVLNLVIGSGFLILLRAEAADFVKWLGAGLSLIAAILTGFQKHFGFQKAVTGHRSIAGRYLDLAKECSNVLADFEDGQISPSQLLKRRDAIQKVLSRIDHDAHAFVPSPKDYDLAKQGMAAGEETYTDEDLKAGEYSS